MGRKEENIKKAQALLHQKERIRNIGTAAHVDHGKTTLSDSLIAGADVFVLFDTSNLFTPPDTAPV